MGQSADEFYKQLISVGESCISESNSDDSTHMNQVERIYERAYDVLGWLMDVAELAAEGGGYKQVASV